jgi:hypothetical protein
MAEVIFSPTVNGNLPKDTKSSFVLKHDGTLADLKASGFLASNFEAGDILQITCTDAYGLYQYGGASTLNIYDTSATINLPVGAIMMWGTATIPTGWLELNGQAISATTYPVLSTLYGANLPDTRGYFIRAEGTNSDGTASAALLTAQGDAIRNITGSITGISETFSKAAASGATSALYKSADTPSAEATPKDVDDTNAGTLSFDASKSVPTAPENRPKNMALKYIIKAW